MTGLPLFLHCRAAFDDFIGNMSICLDATINVSALVEILKRNRDKINGGVVSAI